MIDAAVDEVLGRSGLGRVSLGKNPSFEALHQRTVLFRCESSLNFRRPERVTLELFRDRIGRVLILVNRKGEVTSIKLVVLDSLTFGEVLLESLTEPGDVQSRAVREIRDRTHKPHGEQIVLEHTRDFSRVEVSPDEMFVSSNCKATSHTLVS